MLEVQGLRKMYGKNLAVDQVSFFVPDGQIGILLEYINRKQAAQRQSDPNLRRRALELVAEIGASVTMLQRKMEIGAVEAELLIDWMAQKGYIARPDQKGWRVLFTPEQARTLDLGD